MKAGKFVSAITVVVIAGLLAALAGAIFLWPRVVRPSEKTFADVARRVYGDENFWLPLAAMNSGRVVRPWMVVRIPSKRAAQNWLRDFLRRRGGPDNEAIKPYASEGELFPLSAESERWIADSVEAPSPSGRLLLCEGRGLESPGRNYAIWVVDAQGRRLGGYSGGDCRDGVIFVRWRDDSNRFVAKVHTGWDAIAGESPGTRYAYIVGEAGNDRQRFEFKHLDSNADLDPKAVDALLSLPVEKIAKLLGTELDR